MAWSTSDLANYNDIIVQDGVKCYNFRAEGDIKKGQALYISGNAYQDSIADVSPCVGTATAGTRVVGFAMYDADDGDMISVAGRGNIVYACFNTTGAANIPVYGSSNGILSVVSGNADFVAGYIVQSGTSISTNYVGQVLVTSSKDM